MKIGIAGPITLRMLAPLFPLGTELPETYSFPLVATIAQSMHARGHEVTVFALSRDVGSTQVFSGDRIRAYVCPQRRPRWQMLDFFSGERRALREAMQSSGCDVVHAFWTYEFGSAAVTSGLPHVMTAQDVPHVVLRFARHPYWMIKPWLAFRALRNARCVTAVSPYTAKSLHRFWRPQRDIVVIPNAVGASFFDLYERHRQPSGEQPFTFTSILNEWAGRKNGKRLIEAFSVVRKQLGHRVELRMLGQGHQQGGPAYLWSRKRHLEDGIEFVGPCPYDAVLRSLVEQTNVLVHPSLEETFGMVLVEAMAMGIPTIGGADSGGVPWVLGNGDAGLLVDVRSAESLAAGMMRMVEEPELRDRFAEAGHVRATAMYRLETVVDQYLALLTRAVAEHGSKAANRRSVCGS